MDNLNGNHDRIMNLEARGGQASTLNSGFAATIIAVPTVAMMTPSCGRRASSTTTTPRPQPRTPMQAKTAHTSQFFSTRQLSPAAVSELHTLAAAFIDTKGPIEAR
jgi:hypothetical protein